MESLAPRVLRVDAWYIHGKPHDLRPWLDRHPGGKYILEVTRGTDCTELFESYHAPSFKASFIRDQLAKYAAADREGQPHTPGEAAAYDWIRTPVYDELKRVVRSGWNSRHLDPPYRCEPTSEARDSRTSIACQTQLHGKKR